MTGGRRGLLLAALVVLASAPDFVYGTPGKARVALILLVAGVTGWVARRADAAAWLDARLASPRLAWALVAGWIAVAVALSLAKYHAFGDTLGYDVAYHVQVLWNTLHGRPLEGNILLQLHFDPPIKNHMGVHVSPVFLSLLPLFAVFPDVRLLLVVKCLGVGLGAVPLYALARPRLGAAAAFLLVAAYLLHPVVAGQMLGPFYPVSMAPPLALGALWAWDRRRPVAFALLAAGLLGMREDIGLLMVMFPVVGLVERFVAREPRRPLAWLIAPAVLGFGWYLVCGRYLMPALGGGNPTANVAHWYAGFGDDPGAIVRRIVTDPVYTLGVIFTGHKLFYLWQMLRPFALSPLLGAPALLALPPAGINLLVTRPSPPTTAATTHYSLVLTCCLAAGAVAGLAWVRRRWGAPAATFATLLAVAVAMSQVTTPLSRHELAKLKPRDNAAELRAAVVRVPEGATVAAPGYVLPFLARTPEGYSMDRIGHYPEFRPEYVLYDRDPSRFYLEPGTEAAYRARVARFDADPGYEVLQDARGTVLLHRRDASR